MNSHRSTARFRILLGCLALCLALPALASPWTDLEGRSQAMNRNLHEAPAIEQLWQAPQAFFRQINLYIEDHTRGVLLAQQLYGRTRYYVFNDSPSELIHMGREHTTFLHTMVPDRPFVSTRLCQPAVMDLTVNEVTEAARGLRDYLAEQGRELRILIAPSKTLLYGDRFAETAPVYFQRACEKAMTDNTLRRLNDDPDVLIDYPYDALFARREDPTFFPVSNFHWQGESVHTAVEDWIARQPETPLTEFDGSYTVEMLPDDLSRNIGFERPYPGRVYDYDAHGVSENFQLPGESSDALIDARRQKPVYTTAENPLYDRRVLLLTNSYGIEGHVHLAPLYREMVWINTNGIPRREMRALLEEWMPEYDPDLVILLFHDVAARRRIPLIYSAVE